MNRIFVNFRAFVIIAVAIAMAIFFSFVTTMIPALGITFIALEAALFCLAGYHYYKLKERFKIFTFLAAIVLSVFAYFNFLIKEDNFIPDWFDDTAVYEISGVCDSKILTENDEYLVDLDNLKLNGTSTDGRMRIYITPEDRGITFYLREGDTVFISLELSPGRLISEENRINASYARTDLRYFAYAKDSELMFEPGQVKGLDAFSIKMREALCLNLGDTRGYTAYGMITGDKTGISDETLHNYNASGIRHILAVSGLHIGFLTAVLSFILDKLRIRKKISFAVILLVLILYAAIAGFSPSVLRAVIMSACFLAAGAFGFTNDPLNSLGLAAAVILTAFPFYMFEVGFQLSFAAVLGIIMFSSPLKRALLRIKIPKFIASPLSLSTSVQLFIVPVQILQFGEFQLYSILANIVLMPIMSVAFIAVLVSTLISLAIPALEFFIVGSGWLISAIDVCSAFVAKLPFSIIKYRSASVILLVYLLFFLMSRFFMLETARKKINFISASLSVVLVLNGLLLYPPRVTPNSIISVNGGYRDTGTVVITETDRYAVGGFHANTKITDTLDHFMIRSLDAVFLHDLSVGTARRLVDFVRVYNVKKIYCPEGANIDGIYEIVDSDVRNFYLFDETTELPCGVSGVFSENGFVCYKAEQNGAGILFFGPGCSYLDADLQIINEAAIIRTAFYSGDYNDRIFLTNSGVKSGFDGAPPLYLFEAANTPGYYFDYKNGKIRYKR